MNLNRGHIREIYAKSILRKFKTLDSWFLSCYGMNLYRGCMHNCVYCDGRTENYYVQGEFGETITVKVNALEILDKELNPKRKRKPLRKCFFVLGGGVGDSYQPVEEKYELTRGALELFLKWKYPVSILTKSNLVLRDLDLIEQINAQNRAIVSFSFSSLSDDLSSLFEPFASPPSERIEAIKFLKKAGIPCGMFLMPIIPGITDTSELVQKAIRLAEKLNIDFILFSSMTLKQGKQKDYFMDVLSHNFPDKVVLYDYIYYPDNHQGQPNQDYSQSLNSLILSQIQGYSIPLRIPPYLYNDILNENDKIKIMLEHLNYLIQIRGGRSPYGYAAYSISKLDTPLSNLRYELNKIKGVGNTTKRLIEEYISTGTCKYFEKMLANII